MDNQTKDKIMTIIILIFAGAAFIALSIWIFDSIIQYKTRQ